MTDALIEYGLFAAKSLTVIAFVGLLLIALSRARGSLKSNAEEDGSRLEVFSLNDRYANMADIIRAATLPGKLYKKTAKEERKASKQREKADTLERPRMFVIDFEGDIMASEVSGLREMISALLAESRPGDQVLVRLDNAGGAVHEHGLAASQLMRIKARGIPLTLAVDKVAASGGYLMACVADRIIAAPFAIIGSIGVLAELPNFHRLLERSGVDFELHTAGEYKRTLTLFGENTDEGRQKLREQLEQTHALFKAFIATNRPDVNLARVATGEYWYGEQALELGLVDELKTSDDYLLEARQSAELYHLRYKARKRPLERLLGAMRSTLARIVGRATDVLA
ncbi:MAG: protease SohB [Thiohalocapsa sp.]|nr:protease SohB [Thiohalocapsa sp.]MCF7989292.1 protease SohB [Thiohalocapsa sp.]